MIPAPVATPDPAVAEPKADADPAAPVNPDKPAEPAAGAPEAYEPFKAPDGTAIDEKIVAEAAPIFKELNLTQDQAQKLVDVWNKHISATPDAMLKEYQTTRQGWRTDIAKSDLGDGKDNIKPEVRANISKVFEAVGDAAIVKDFKAAMDLTGAGDHPAFIRVMNSLGKLVGEGTLVRGGAPSPAGQKAPGKGPPSAAQALYPNLPSSS